MEYIHKLLHRAASQSSSPSPTSGNDSSVTVPKTAEHEVKVRFAREFADVESIAENLCLAPESLSSTSSFHSLQSSTFSIKSNSSGICPDSTLENLDNAADTSYVNSNIPDVDDLVRACASIRLESERDIQDLSQNQTFTSAADETLSFSANDYSLNEDLLDDDDNKTAETNFQVHETTSLNHILKSPNSTFSIQESELVNSHSAVENNVQVEKPIDTSLQENDNIVSEAETCNIDVGDDSLPTNNVNDDQLNVTIVLSDNTTSNVIVSDKEQITESDCISETLPQEDPQLCPTEISVPSISLTPYIDLSLPNVSNTLSPLEETDNKTKETSIQSLLESTQDISTALSSSDNSDSKSCVSSQIIANNSVVQTETNEIKEQELSQLDNFVASDKESDILNETSVIEPKTSEAEENLQTSIDKKETDTSVLKEIQKSPEKENIICNETRTIENLYNPTDIVDVEKEKYIVDSAAANIIKEDSLIKDLDHTLTLQEVDINFDLDEEQFQNFKPQRQSTTLSLINVQCNEKLNPIEDTNELLNSFEPVKETTQFVDATSEIFQDPSTFDFLSAISNFTHTSTNRLRTESLYVKFDPLISNTSMLPQGNTQMINEEKNDKNESPLPNVDTPKRNPAIAAIDRLLFFSPLPNATVQKLEEDKKKSEQPAEESESNALIDQVDMSKELELVRTTVLQLEEQLEKQKKEQEAELERQKATFQEKINKLQTQLAQEVKTRTQMAVVVEEYEKSISRLLTEREQDKAKLQEELQAANHHLTNTEAAFNDVHKKYERLKGVVSAYKNNETVLKESIQENVQTIRTLETRYNQLKEHAIAQLEKANLELDGIRKQNEAETVKLHAMIRKAELKSNSLAELVEQKTKENKELVKILDEVIARVGHGNSE